MQGKQVDGDAFLVSKTDVKGVITYCNLPFADIVGTTSRELVGKPHNIVRHPDMPRVIFALLWERIKNKQEIFAFIKNRTFDGSFYWVFANVTASLDENGAIVGYYSVRRRPNPKAIEAIIPLYDELLKAEKSGGIDASRRALELNLAQQNSCYDEFINNLQRI